jgi:hypothetical protein
MRAVLAAAALALAACGGPPDEQGGETFLAFPTHFRDYQQWESFEIQSPVVEGAVHVSGARTVYLNQRPAAGATAFPVGTIIVKHSADRVFARVKRGGGYNAGAPGWEWFELQPGGGGVVTISWRGVGPPTGEGYGGDPNGCNSCHAASKTNDYVSAEALSLSGL